MRTQMFKVIMVVGVASVFVLTWYVSDVRRLTRDFSATTPFTGAVVETLVRFALAQYRAPCSIGANSEGLYMAPSPATMNRKWYHPGYHTVITPLFIPWTALQYRTATMPLSTHVRFDVPSLRIGLSPVCFFIPRKDAESVLASVGRRVPPG
jgi:hypothetical protein